jgi:hypothetical protein
MVLPCRNFFWLAAGNKDVPWPWAVAGDFWQGIKPFGLISLMRYYIMI